MRSISPGSPPDSGEPAERPCERPVLASEPDPASHHSRRSTPTAGAGDCSLRPVLGCQHALIALVLRCRVTLVERDQFL